MGLFDLLFGNRPQPKGDFQGTFKMLNGYTPHFSTWGGSIYESELVRAAINSIATACSKLDVTIQGTAKPALQTKLRRGPNQTQTWSQLLYVLATRLYVHNTAFLVPAYDTFGEPSGIYSVLPDRCEIVQYGEAKVPYLRFQFSWGEWAAVELAYCGVMTRFQYRSDLLGETNRALLPTMDLISMQDQGIKEAVKNGASFKWIARLSNFAKPEDLKKERLRFSEENLSRDAGGGGLLLFPNTYSDIKQVEAKPFVVDDKQMEIIRAGVFEYFGVNEKVLTSAAFGDDWSAFYESTVEPFAIMLSQTMTKMLFSAREQAQGSGVTVTANRLQYMTNADKLAVSSEMLDRGIMSMNEIREIWQLPPVEGGDVRIIRGEYYTTDEKGVTSLAEEQDAGTET